MSNKPIKALHALLLSAAIAMPTVAVQGAVSPAYATSKNYIKISKNAIGQAREIKVGLNKSMVIDLPADAHDILVANPEVADAITRTSKRIYIFAKKVGETNIFIFDKAGNQLLSLDLSIERDVAGLEKYIEKYVRGADVKVEIVNDNIILTGTVPTPQASAKAVQLAQIFVKGGEATTPSAGTRSTSGSGTIIDFGEEDTRESTIVNLLSIDGEDQVTLKVTIAEIQRSVVKQLGIDMSGSLSSGGMTSSIFTDSPLPLGKFGSSSSGTASYSNGGNSIGGVLRALSQAGVMRTLAEPSLTAISGEAASFSVGGEYQISTGKDESDDGVVYQFKEISYGIDLNFKPVVLSPGRISLQIQTAVSEPTSEGNHVVGRGGAGAVSHPGVRRRSANTTVELPSGGSMVIAGLIKDDVRQTVTGFPGLSKLPIIGTLFRSRDFQRYESELVIIVTPYLVKPVARQALARPDDNFNAAADSAGYFLGRVNRIYGTKQGNLPAGRYRGNPGFIFK
ncbi:MAG: type II and III secretion system protein family protein [Salaquimonas sp.]